MVIHNFECIPVTGRKNNTFVGLKFSGDDIKFYYPETYDLSNHIMGLRKDILSILRGISIVKSDYDNHLCEHFNNLTKKGDIITSFLWIINDYLTYGTYIEKEKIITKGINGKINWKKTMQTQPIISSEGFVYQDFYCDSTKQINTKIIEIYNYCCFTAIRYIGWLFDIKFDEEKRNFKFNQKEYMSVIQNELYHTFSDEKIKRLNVMLSIVSQLENNSESNSFSYGVDSFDYTYEHMINGLYSNISNISDFYPRARWHLDIDNAVYESTKLRPDTIIIRDNGNMKNMYILDAKNYRFGVTFNYHDLPETTSIQKQITYGEYIRKLKNGEYDNIYSAFIIPYNKTKNIYSHIYNNDIEIIGEASADWINSEKLTNRRIVTILIDMKFLIDNYSKKDRTYADDLTSLIENRINNKKWEGIC